jgi:catalase (peroxidase I)
VDIQANDVDLGVPPEPDCLNGCGTRSRAGATQWIPTDGQAAATVPDAHDPSKRHAPIMFTTDLALGFDQSYAKVTKRFANNPEESGWRLPRRGPS